VIATRTISLFVLALLFVACTEDLDGDGYGAELDCDDSDPAVHPGAREYWDGKDNDCDGVVDVSPEYRWFVEAEPNDTELDECFAGAGQFLGTLAPLGMTTVVDGRIDTVVELDYAMGDRDCLSFYMAETAVLHVEISWPEPSTDIDFAVQSVWGEDGSQQTFLGSTDSNPFSTSSASNGTLSPQHALYLWMTAYEGAPTTYRITMWTTPDADEGETDDEA